jgi:tetratricopeptide (TPR) repeat protein
MEKWDKAYYYFRQVSLLGETPEIKARALNNVGAMHWLRGKYRLAYENFKESQGLQENPKTLYNIVGAEIFLGAEVALENNYLLMKKMPITETQWLCQKFLAEWTLKKYEEGISTYKQLLAQSLGKNDTLLFHLRALEMALKIGQQDTIKKIVSDHRTNFSLSTEYKNFSTLYPEIKKYE